MTRDTAVSPISSCLDSNYQEILTDWVQRQLSVEDRSKAVSDASIRNSSGEFLKLFQEAAKAGNFSNLNSAEWAPVKQLLSELSSSRAVQGSTPTETAGFVLSLKQPLFEKITKLGDRSGDSLWVLSNVLDGLSLYTTEVFQKSREAIIRRQQKEMLEMSTPVIKLWDGVLAVPLIGTLDSARTQIVMENLLQRIIETGSKVAILDITGVPTVDTQTAQHLIKTVSATRLMGADCIISGIRPQIAQTIVHLGIDIFDITTKATMADAIKEALVVTGWTVKPLHDQHVKGED
jgi:rsbT co-antagonist protein RsbR